MRVPHFLWIQNLYFNAVKKKLRTSNAGSSTKYHHLALSKVYKKKYQIHSFSLLEYTITATIRHKEGEKRKIQQTINKIDEQIAPIKDITLNNR